jgi:hypothetical protein
MARMNPGWRYTRIRGALCTLGHEIHYMIQNQTLDIGTKEERESLNAAQPHAAARPSLRRTARLSKNL